MVLLPLLFLVFEKLSFITADKVFKFERDTRSVSCQPACGENAVCKEGKGCTV